MIGGELRAQFKLKLLRFLQKILIFVTKWSVYQLLHVFIKFELTLSPSCYRASKIREGINKCPKLITLLDAVWRINFVWRRQKLQVFQASDEAVLYIFVIENISDCVWSYLRRQIFECSKACSLALHIHISSMLRCSTDLESLNTWISPSGVEKKNDRI